MSYLQERDWFVQNRMRSKRDLNLNSAQNWNISRRNPYFHSINQPRRGRASFKSRPSYSHFPIRQGYSRDRGRTRFQGSVFFEFSTSKTNNYNN